MGSVSESRKQILLNILDQELSRHINFTIPPEMSSGKLDKVKNIFQLQIIEEEGDTQLNLRWISEDKRRIETKICFGCETNQLERV